MVHGTTLTVRYLIKLSKPIDYYDQFLPICISERKMFKLLDNDVIEILCENELWERFDCLESTQSFYEFCGSLLHYDTNKTDEVMKKRIKYNRAFIYSSELKIINKNNYNVDKFYSEEEIAELNARLNELKERMEYGEEAKNICNIIKYNPILCPGAYSDEILALEANGTNIELREDEKALIERVKSNSIISEFIEKEGFQMYSYNW